MRISISEGFYILVLLLDSLVLKIDLDLFTVLLMFFLSFLWVYLNLYNDSPLSYLLLMDVSTVLLNACDFYVVFIVSILLFAMVVVMASFTILGFFSMAVSSSLKTVSVVVTNEFSGSSKHTLVFLTVILWSSEFSGNGSLTF